VLKNTPETKTGFPLDLGWGMRLSGNLVNLNEEISNGIHQ